MKKGMLLFLYSVAVIWTIVGLLIVRGAWKESEADYEPVIGTLSQPLELSYDLNEEFSEPDVVMAKLYMNEDGVAYTLAGKLYRQNRAGLEALQVGDSVRLMVKKTSFVGGFPVDSSSKSAPISGMYKANGEAIIPLEKGLEQSRKRLMIGIGFMLMGIAVGIWTYVKS